MTFRQRFLETMHFGSPDQIPYWEFHKVQNPLCLVVMELPILGDRVGVDLKIR